jgi:phosphate transport system substrate-binding protein
MVDVCRGNGATSRIPRTVISRTLRCLIVASFIALSLTGVASAAVKHPTKSSTTVILTGAGSTFDAPFFNAAFSAYEKLNPHVAIRYAAVGSGLGISRFSSGTVNFGASDVPMTSAEQAGVEGGRVLQIPIALGAVVISYNLSAGPLSQPLRLSGQVLAEIYLGQVTNWDNSAIAALNPGVLLPNESIVVVHRSDGSGTTYIFTNFLSSVSSAWSNGPGTNKVVKWPAGIGAKGSPGVADDVKHIPGAIGYFELSYAESHDLPYFAIENLAGTFVAPFAASVAADASKNPNVSASHFSIVNEPGSASYPISGYSWLLLYQHQTNRETGTALANLVEWMINQGQTIAGANYYVPLPVSIRLLAKYTITRLVGPSGTHLGS